MEREVLEANGAFYSAFVRRDLRAMEHLWARDAPVACIHPGWEPLRGREAVLQSLRAIFSGGGAPASITCYGPTVHFLGEAAYVICTERVPGGALAATNLFVREDGQWKLAHHQAAPISQRLTSKPPPKAPPQGPMN